jgi:hypothetical protein
LALRSLERTFKDARARSAVLKDHHLSVQRHGLFGYMQAAPSKQKRERPRARRPTGTDDSDQLGSWSGASQHCCWVPLGLLLRKEVIQPHLPVRLPCYDFTPITDPTFDGSFLTVRPPASGVADFRGVTGGVYKARERIHPGNADPGLLATPASWSRVADSNPN